MKKNAAWVAADGKGSVLYYGGPYLVVNRTYGLHKSLYIYIFFFFSQYLVLFTIVPRTINSVLSTHTTAPPRP